MNDLLIRLLFTLGLIAIGIGAYRMLNAALLARGGGSGVGLEGFLPGRPGILYFTMEGCLPCRTTQRPALNDLASQLGEGIQILEVDVVVQPEMAKSWQVVSVPTTIILDPQGKPRHVNHGVTLEGALLDQLKRFGGLAL